MTVPDFEKVECGILGDWIEKALAAAVGSQMPDGVRAFIVSELKYLQHRTYKQSEFSWFEFNDGVLEMIESLAGPFPEIRENTP